jgi:hypothetical protein
VWYLSPDLGDRRMQVSGSSACRRCLRCMLLDPAQLGDRDGERVRESRGAACPNGTIDGPACRSLTVDACQTHGRMTDG